MKRIKLILTALLVIAITMVVYVDIGKSDLDPKTRLTMKLKKPTREEELWLGFNNWAYALKNEGSYFYRVSRLEFGGEFPRGSNYGAVYAGGLYVAGRKSPPGGGPSVINAANCEFDDTEFQPGKIYVNNDYDHRYRGYTVANTGSYATATAPFSELKSGDPGIDEYQVYVIDEERSGSDWDNWPEYAPRDTNDLPFLLPGVAGQTYAVFNDLSISKVSDTYSPYPGFGLEVEMETFNFTAGALANGVFLKLTITNKSAENYNDAYIGIWCDADVGSASAEDQAGVDTTEGLGIVYSSPTGGDVHPIALGLDFFQGPVVDQADVPQYLYDKFYNRPANRQVVKYDKSSGALKAIALPDGKFTLSATAFISYPNPEGEPEHLYGDITRHYYMRGLDGTGNPKPNGPYDPTATGIQPKDQRIIHGSGPFILKSGETQEVWMGFASGMGNSQALGGSPVPSGGFFNRNSGASGSAINVMYTTDLAMQQAFNAALSAPVPPETPVVVVSSQDNKVVLTWDNRSEFSRDSYGDSNKLDIKTTNNYNKNWVQYDFQGYRVYKSLTGLSGSFTKVAEYDLIDNVTTENDTLSDGKVLYDVHFGSNTGLKHYYEDTDVINGRRYYYSVTAYDYQPLIRSSVTGVPTGFPRSLENSITGKTNLRSVVPMPPVAGSKEDARANDTLTLINGYGNPRLITRVINPDSIKNREFYIEFFKVPDSVDSKPLIADFKGQMAFQLIDKNTSEVVKFDNYRDDPRTFVDYDNNGVYNDGIDAIYDDSKFSLAILAQDIQGNNVESSNTKTLPIINGVELKISTEVIGIKAIYEIANSGGILTAPKDVYYSNNTTANFQINVMTTTAPASAADKGITGRNWLNTYNNPSFTSDYEIRFVSGANDSSNVYFARPTQYQTSQFHTSNCLKSPRKAPFQIWSIGLTPNNPSDDRRLMVRAVVNTPPSNNINALFEFSNLCGTSDSVYSERIFIVDSAYNDTVTTFGAISSSLVKVTNLLIKKVDGTKEAPPAGTIIRIVTYKPIQTGDRYLFKTTANTAFNKKLAKKALNDIKVVPNPYYGRVLEYQSSLFDKKVKFVGLPRECTIYIFTVSGDLIRTIRHNDATTNNRINYNPLDLNAAPKADYTSIEEWDLRNQKGTFVASGMYVAFIDAKGVGTKTVKFAIIQEEMRIDGPDAR